jgi:hypothetical protein
MREESGFYYIDRLRDGMAQNNLPLKMNIKRRGIDLETK